MEGSLLCYMMIYLQNSPSRGQGVDSINFISFWTRYGFGVPSTATPTQVKTRFSLVAPEAIQMG